MTRQATDKPVRELNRERLKNLETWFLQEYPGGFEHPEIVKIGKKHRVGKMTEFSREAFSRTAMKHIDQTIENMIKVVSRSSMVSLFEKPKFRDFVNQLSSDEKEFLVNALKRQLHGKQSAGFEAMVDLLATGKLAKWSLLTIIPAYYKPDEEVFVKPTTAKGVLKYFDRDEPVYNPKPSWAFYQHYRELINRAKTRVSKSLSPSNAAFSGFLMMSIGR